MKVLNAALAAAVAVSIGSSAAAGNCAVPREANAMAQQVGDHINAQRRAAGLPALRIDRRLVRAAAGHACDMAAMGRMTHTSSNGMNVLQRAQAAGVRVCTIAENTAWGRPYEAPTALVSGWMNSSGHRANILMDRGVSHFGAAVAYDGNTPYWTWVVARPC